MHFTGYLQRMSGLKLRATDKFVETEDAIFFEATIDLDAGVAKAYDAFVLENGRAGTTSRACSASRPRLTAPLAHSGRRPDRDPGL